jgi:CheY-like chemotaxis protein
MLKIRQNLPIVLCSGYSDAITLEEAKTKGIKEYLMKPLSIPQLACTLSGFLQKSSCRISPEE